ncbi:MAG: OmpA family protein [Myxococcota bacterium]
MTQNRLHRILQAALLGLGGFAADSAVAQDFSDGPPYSVDIEFLRPQFGQEGFVGVDAPIANRNLTWRVGTVLQYEQAPLTLYEALDDAELGAVVANRFSALTGASIDVNRVSFSMLVPLAANWGTDADQFSQPGFFMGDVGGSVKVVALQTRNDVFNIGARAGLILPTGRQAAYVGEGRLRTNLGLLATLGGGPIRFASDLSLGTRTTVRTTEDFIASNELVWGNAVRYKLPDASRLALNAQLLTRAGLSNQFLRGGAENAMEVIGGAELYPSRSTTFGVGVGRGLTEGYGTTDFRVLTHLTVQVPPREQPPGRYTTSAPPPPPPPPPVETFIEEPVFEEGEVVKQIGEEIFIKDMVEFVVDTAKIQDYSKPTLTKVAEYINSNPKIATLVVEGHASQEGSYEHNYELAESRARSIWEFFMELGVAKERISYRGMGEVEPVVENGVPVIGVDEESLQKNRRVRFLVTRQFDDPSQYPDYPDTQVLPWNAEVVKVVQPPREVEEAPKGPKLDEFGLPIQDDDELDLGTPGGSGSGGSGGEKNEDTGGKE